MQTTLSYTLAFWRHSGRDHDGGILIPALCLCDVRLFLSSTTLRLLPLPPYLPPHYCLPFYQRDKRSSHATTQPAPLPVTPFVVTAV